jgi:predicted DNA-binding transcriptional regulator AlpA
MSTQEHLDIYQAASRYRVSASTIRRWFANGQMPSPRSVPGGGYGWPLSVLREWEGSVVMAVAESDRQKA